MRTAIDLFAGTGAATAELARRGWRVIRVEINPAFEADWRDIRSFVWDGDPVDFVWASPPCTEFSRTFMPWIDQDRPSLEAIELIFHTLRVIREARPRYWILENVKGAQRWLGRAAYHIGSRYLWGWFPFDQFGKYEYPDLTKKWRLGPSPLRPVLRSRIEDSIAWAVAEILERNLNGRKAA